MAKVQVEKGNLGRFSFYNAADVAEEHRGWVLGAFIADNAGSPLTDAFEVKWAHYGAGEGRSEWASPTSGVSVHIVLSGVYWMMFAPNGVDDDILERTMCAGEVCFWENSVPHKGLMEEAGEGITIRRLRD